jgi:hypothetical protein
MQATLRATRPMVVLRAPSSHRRDRLRPTFAGGFRPFAAPGAARPFPAVSSPICVGRLAGRTVPRRLCAPGEFFAPRQRIGVIVLIHVGLDG